MGDDAHPFRPIMPKPSSCSRTDDPDSLPPDRQGKNDEPSMAQVPWPFDLDQQQQGSINALEAALTGLDGDDRPLHEQEWLWAEARAVPFRVHQPDLTWNDPGVVIQAPSFTAWWGVLQAGLNAWRERPLVWRIQDGVAQAVFMGVYRFTWSVHAPQGRCEVQDLGQGWADYVGPLSWPALCLNALGRFSVTAMLVEQIARHAQRHRPRLTLWDMCTALSANPSIAPSLMLDDDLLPVARRARAGLRAFAHALARLDPFWRTVTRTLWRRYPVGLQNTVGTLESDPLPLLLARWNGWKAVAAEHPRAHLLLGDAVRVHHLPPNLHTWRPEVWQTLRCTYGLLRTSTWNAVRHAPLAQVATAFRMGMDAGPGAFEVLTLCQIRHTAPAVLRAVPEAWWVTAKGAFQDHPLREAMATFAVRRVRAFLDAAGSQPWVAQGWSLHQWLLVMQPVMEWATEQDDGPCVDPSWSWNSLVKTWMDQQATRHDWPLPLQPCFHQGVRVSVVSTDAGWELLGGVMDNCLQDNRSDSLRERVRQQRGILVRLSGPQTSAVFFGWNEAPQDESPEFSDEARALLANDARDVADYARDHGYIVPGMERQGKANDHVDAPPVGGRRHAHPRSLEAWDRPAGAWTIDQHYAGCNTIPAPLHEAVAQDLLALFNASLVPGRMYPPEAREQRLQESRRSDLLPLLDDLTSAWGPDLERLDHERKRSNPRPSWPGALWGGVRRLGAVVRTELARW